VISAPREEINGRIVVEWHPNMERIRYQRTDGDGKVVLRLKEPGIGGFYEPDAFPIADSPPVPLLNKDESSELSPVFSVGDRVQVDPAITIEEFGSKQKEVGGSISKVLQKNSLNYPPHKSPSMTILLVRNEIVQFYHFFRSTQISEWLGLFMPYTNLRYTSG